MYNEPFIQLFINRPQLKGTFVEKMLEKCFDYVCMNCDMVITICNTAEKALLKRNPGIKVTTVYNSVRSMNSEREYKVKNEINVVIASSVTKRKGFDLFLSALEEMNPEKRVLLQFHIFGNGDLLPYVKKFSAEHGYANIVCYGDVSAPYLQYADKDVFLLVSRDETLPMGIIEAMNAGLPIFSTNVGAIDEMVIMNENGILFPPTVDGIIKGLERIVDCRENFQQWGRESQKRFKMYFESSIWTKKLAEVLTAEAVK